VGACFIIIAAKPNVVLTAAAMVVFGFVITLANVISVSLRQLVTPDGMLGRVISVHRLLCWGALPVGAALAGLAGNSLGVRSSVAVCGVAVVVCPFTGSVELGVSRLAELGGFVVACLI
jgi:hypothetical protein